MSRDEVRVPAQCLGSFLLQGGMGAVIAAALDVVHVTEGLAAAQTLIDRIGRLPSPGGDFWRAAVQLEAAAASGSGTSRGVSPAQVAALDSTAVIDRDMQCRITINVHRPQH